MSSIEASGKIAWVLNRLSCMSPAEVLYRGKQSLTSVGIKCDLLSGRTTEMPRALGSIPIPSLNIGEQVRQQYLQDANDVAAGNIKLFSSHEFGVGDTPNWNRDPLTGVVGPSMFFDDIMLTDRNQVGDIKYLWELNRHLQLVRLAQAYALSRTRDYLDALVIQIDTWLDQCPPFIGPNWTSSLEVAIRLINWSLIWNMIGGWSCTVFSTEAGMQLRSRWLASVFAHCKYIGWHLSRYSSANNHLIGELTGLYVAARTWPCWSQSAQWCEQAKAELECQATLQFADDGVNREQAFSYQVFVSEFLLVAGVTGERSDDPFSETYWGNIQRAINFIRSMQDVGGRIPMVGDADDGAVFLLEPGIGIDRHLILLSLGNALASAKATEPPSLSAQWLLIGLERFRPLQAGGSNVTWQFPQGGYYLFGSNFGSENEVKGMVDCGPLGYLGIAAHGHADALSLTLSICGEECLVDPGTFSYWNEIKWRDYFRGTAAHNTVAIDGRDQSVSGGRFMWTRKAQACVKQHPVSPDQFDLVGSHDGYMRLSSPVLHTRSVHYDGLQMTLRVTDEITAEANHIIEQFWHFSPDVHVELSHNAAVVSGKRFRVRASFSGNNLDLALFQGSENPTLGWFSRAYESKVPCTTLRVRTSSSATTIDAQFSIEVLQQIP